MFSFLRLINYLYDFDESHIFSGLFGGFLVDLGLSIVKISRFMSSSTKLM
ncbi:hypothetical protein VCR26J2_660037 [Vibrio coralliirubri]|nr:hypothetical protein VCR26J2_660037 [Vibrio coralliirubri]